MAQKNRKNAKNDQKNNRSDILTPDSDSTPKNYLGMHTSCPCMYSSNT